MDDLIAILGEARARVAESTEQDYDWSSWRGPDHALEELDALIAGLQAGREPDELTLQVIFMPTGPLQEVSLAAGWGDDFLALAARFDEALASMD